MRDRLNKISFIVLLLIATPWVSLAELRASCRIKTWADVLTGRLEGLSDVPDFVQRMTLWARGDLLQDKAVLFEEFKQNLEWAYANDDDTCMLRVIDHYGDDESLSQSNFLGAIRTRTLFRLNHDSDAIQVLRSTGKTFSKGEIKLLQKYDLLSMLCLSADSVARYDRLSPQGRLDALAPIPDRYATYLRARTLWQLGRHPAALELFTSLTKVFTPDDVLYDEVNLYRASSAFQSGDTALALRIIDAYQAGPNVFSKPLEEQGFVEVEGVFTGGNPVREYLKAWRRTIEEGRGTWWYETIGYAAKPIRHVRLYSSFFGQSPMARLAAEAIRSQSDAEIAVINHKGLRGGLEAGPIRRHQLFLIAPWNNHVLLAQFPATPSILSARDPEEIAARLFPTHPQSLTYPDPITVAANKSDTSRAQATLPIAISDYLQPYLMTNEPFKTLDQTDRGMLEAYILRRKTITPEDEAP